ncbi:MAG: VWA domain-containing protein [Phycisphaeraceae bacterium]|nr:VWA domain-containing protein [Phycisphaeraceae bacterium]
MSGLSVDQLGPLLLIPVLGVVVLITAQRLRLMSGLRRASAVLFRLALIAIIALALAGASAIRTTERVAVIVMVDVSGSVQRFANFGQRADGSTLGVLDAAVDWLERARQSAIGGARPDDLVGVIAFDGRAVAVTPLTSGPLGSVDVPIAFDGTDIAAAIRAAHAMAPPSTRLRLVLISDGNQTVGDATTVPTRAPIDVLPVRYRVEREVAFESLEAPARAVGGPDAAIDVRAVLRSAGAGIVPGTIRLSVNGDPVGPTRRVELREGLNVERFVVPLDSGRVHRIEGVFEPDAGPDGRPYGDTIAENNRAEAITLSTGPASVLLIDPTPGGVESTALAEVFRSAGLDVEVTSGERLAVDPLWMQTRDAVVLTNVPADAMPREAHALLSSYVMDAGGGLIMVGGEDSFAPGGWRGTAIEPLLPVALDLPERILTPGAAVVLVIDVSGSMRRSVMGTGLSQMRIAAEGAAEAIRTLDKTDLVGVITFSDVTSTVVPLGPNNDAEATAVRVRRISADGGTVMGPALEAARAQLQRVTADEKHVILLSDGMSQDVRRLPAIGDALAAEGVRITSIAVGDQADADSLRDLSVRGGGRFYRVVDPTLLPRVMVKAVRVVRTPMIKRGRITVVPIESAVAGGLAPGAVPELSGLVMTRLRPEPTVTHGMFAELPRAFDAEPAESSEPTPLLSYWNVGVGRVGVFTSDARDWARAWIGWPGFAGLWLRYVEAIARQRPERGLELRAWVEEGEDRLWVRVESTEAMDLDVPVRVFSAGAAAGTGGVVGLPSAAPPTELRLEQIGPGEFQGWVRAERAGAYVVVATPRRGVGGIDAGTALAPLVGGVVRAGGAEFRALASNDVLLERLRDAGGGRELDWAAPESAGLFGRAGLAPARERRPLWWALLWAALVVMMLDVATRRIAWDRYFGWGEGAASASAWRSRTAEAIRDRSDESVRAIERLKGASGGDDLRSTGADAAHSDRSLSDQDALELVRRAAERRKGQHRPASPPDAGAVEAPEPATFRSVVPSRPPDRSVEKDAPDSAESPIREGAVEPGQSALFAAKRRARERMEGTDDRAPGGG